MGRDERRTEGVQSIMETMLIEQKNLLEWLRGSCNFSRRILDVEVYSLSIWEDRVGV